MHIPKEYWMVVVCAACCSFLSFCPPPPPWNSVCFNIKKEEQKGALKKKAAWRPFWVKIWQKKRIAGIFWWTQQYPKVPNKRTKKGIWEHLRLFEAVRGRLRCHSSYFWSHLRSFLRSFKIFEVTWGLFLGHLEVFWGHIWGHSRFLKSLEVIFRLYWGRFWGYSKFLNPFEVMFEVILDVIQDFWSHLRSFLRPYTAFESNNCRCTFIRYFRVGLGFSNSAVETNKSAKKKGVEMISAVVVAFFILY